MSRDLSSDGVLLRQFRAEDYERVLDLWRKGGLPLRPSGRDSLAHLKKQVREPNVLFLVAEAAGRVIGTVLATHDGRKGWINRLAVDAAYQRRGVGRRLILEAERQLAGAGMEIFACLIDAENAVSISLFESLGYSEHPEIRYFAKRTRPDA